MSGIQQKGIVTELNARIREEISKINEPSVSTLENQRERDI